CSWTASFSATRRPPSFTPFPYTTLFRSRFPHHARGSAGHGGRGGEHWLLEDPRRPHLAVIGGATDQRRARARRERDGVAEGRGADRKSTRLNSSHVAISYAVFCLKKKKR